MKLDETAIRAKVIELLDRCNESRLNLWLISGITAGVFQEDVARRIIREELPHRSDEVRLYWDGSCGCGCTSDADIAAEVLGIIGPALHTLN